MTIEMPYGWTPQPKTNIDPSLHTTLDDIKNHKILNKNGIIILHRHKNEQDFFPANFQLIEQKVYGISKIIFLSCLD